MKRIGLITVMLMSVVSGFAQFDFSLDLSEGYESNIFNNPSYYLRDDVLLNEDSLYSNSFYNEAQMNFRYKKKWENDVLKVKGYVGGAYYYTADEAHKLRYKLELSYRTRYDEGKYFEIAPQIFRIRKNGIDQTETILRTPYSYHKLLVPFNFDFYLGNKAWLKIQPAYLYKKYDTHDPEKLFYHSWYVNTELKKKWDREKIQHVVSLTGDVSSRFYSDYELPDEDFLMDTLVFEDLTHKARQWDYYVGKIEYSFKTQDGKLKVGFPVKYVYKKDKLANFFSYSEIIGGYDLTLNFKDVKISQATSYSNRDYLEFMINDVDYLKYNYLRVSSRISWDVSDRVQLNLNGKLVNRYSNRIDETKRYYREYYTYFAEFGVKFSL